MNYQLHDSQINSVYFSNDKIVFYFSQGFWDVDAKGNEVSQKQNCRLVFHIDNEFNLPIDDFVAIRSCKRKSILKPITLERFTKLLKKSTFDVDMEYSCLFANRKMIQLYSNTLKLFIEIFIKDIREIEYVHD